MDEKERKAGNGMNTIQKARQSRGGIPKAVLECSREQARMRQKISEALKHGPLTVPQIHAATGVPANEVFWYLMAWKKYGKIIEDEDSGDYYRYALAKEDKQ